MSEIILTKTVGESLVNSTVDIEGGSILRASCGWFYVKDQNGIVVGRGDANSPVSIQTTGTYTIYLSGDKCNQCFVTKEMTQEQVALNAIQKCACEGGGSSVPQKYEIIEYTTTGSYTAPYTGNYLVEVLGGGAAGQYMKGGDSGGYKKAMVYMNAGDSYYVVIGAAGIGHYTCNGTIDAQGICSGQEYYPGPPGYSAFAGAQIIEADPANSEWHTYWQGSLAPGSNPGLLGQILTNDGSSFDIENAGNGASSLYGGGGIGGKLVYGYYIPQQYTGGTDATGYGSGGGGCPHVLDSSATEYPGNGSPGLVRLTYLGD